MSSLPTSIERDFSRARAVVATAVAFSTFALLRFGLQPRALVAVFVLATLVVLSTIDIERRIIPNQIVLPAAAIVLVAQTALFPERAAEWILAALGAGLLLLVPLLVHPAGIGMGDVKLGLLLGAALGHDVVAALVLGTLSAVPLALFLLLRGGAEGRKTVIPFCPFLSLGAAVVLLFGS